MAVWIDNFVLAGNDIMELQGAIKTFKGLCKKVNLTLKESDEEQLTKMTLLGAELDLERKTVRLMERTWEVLQDRLGDIKKEGTTPRKALGVIGTLMWDMFAIMREPMWRLSGTVGWLSREMGGWKGRWDDNIGVPDEVKEEWDKLSVRRERKVGQGKEGGREWGYSDACEAGLGWVWKVDNGVSWAGAVVKSEIKGASIFIKELYAAVQMINGGKGGIIITDNMAVAHVLVKGNSRHQGANVLLKKIKERPEKVVWVPSECNVADGPSRGVENWVPRCGHGHVAGIPRWVL